MEQHAVNIVPSLLAAVESGDLQKTRTLLQANEGLVNRQLDEKVSSALKSVCR